MTSETKALDKCLKCGATDIALNVSTGLLICHFCRHEWSAGAYDDHPEGGDRPIAEVFGTMFGSGSHQIQAQAVDVLTLKCTACGAEVVVNTKESTQAHCHWCRNKLSINSAVPNGAVPDAVLPFSLQRKEAVAILSEYVNKRKFYAHPKFRAEFNSDNIVGVYLPYLIIDGNLAGQFYGKGEIQTRRYTRTVGTSDNQRTITYYDADVYDVRRSLDFTVDDLILESNADRADIRFHKNTNNVINALLPFDVKEAVRYNSNYLSGFTSEKRDLNIEDLEPLAENKFLTLGRQEASKLISKYDRGVSWEAEALEVKGTRWTSVYLPVWLYSYYDAEKDFTHYAAVNGRTGQVVGSIPLNKARTTLITLAAAAPGIVAGILLALGVGQ